MRHPSTRVPGLKAFVDGLPVSPDSIGMPSMNYGQLVPGWKLLPCRLEVPLTSLLPIIRDGYDDLTKTMRIEPPEEDFPADRVLRALRMPRLEDVPAALVGQLIVEGLYMDFLDAIGGGSVPGTYAYSSLDESTFVEPNTVVFNGTVYRMPNH